MMPKVYKSKIDYWLALPLIYPFYLSVCSMVKGEWVGVLVFFLLIGFIAIVSVFTKYIVEDNTLIVKAALITHQKIDIHSIRKIEKTKSILSAPALSLDRIRIQYNKYDEILVSPKEKKDFVEGLVKINPTIEIKM